MVIERAFPIQRLPLSLTCTPSGTTPPRRRAGFQTRPCPIPVCRAIKPSLLHPRPEMAANGRKNRNFRPSRPGPKPKTREVHTNVIEPHQEPYRSLGAQVRCPPRRGPPPPLGGECLRRMGRRQGRRQASAQGPGPDQAHRRPESRPTPSAPWTGTSANVATKADSPAQGISPPSSFPTRRRRASFPPGTPPQPDSSCQPAPPPHGNNRNTPTLNGCLPEGRVSPTGQGFFAACQPSPRKKFKETLPYDDDVVPAGVQGVAAELLLPNYVHRHDDGGTGSQVELPQRVEGSELGPGVKYLPLLRGAVQPPGPPQVTVGNQRLEKLVDGLHLRRSARGWLFRCDGDVVPAVLQGIATELLRASHIDAHDGGRVRVQVHAPQGVEGESLRAES